MIRMLIADDHTIMREGLKQLFTLVPDVQVVAEAESGAQVIELLRQVEIDLLLLDMTMPGISGVDLIRRVRAAQPALPILVLSIHNEVQVVARALRAGAIGYLTKDSDPDILLAAIRELANGGRFIDPKLVDAIIFETHSDDAPPHEILSDREFQVLQLLAAGESINEIAEMFKLSAKTISTHKMRLMQKLGLGNNIELIRYTIKHGLTSE